jgi:beta-glucosidase
MTDGTQGATDGGRATAFPSGVAMAATWDVDLMRRVGRAIAEEALNKAGGQQVLLAPAINIHRSPLGGRNGEYFSEDPFLTARMAVDYIKGVQGTGAAACVKHFAYREESGGSNLNVGERALREIYLPAFEAAVKEAHVRAVMSELNGFSNGANSHLLTDVLKKEWGFDGLVMSWEGVRDVTAVQLGNDLEMPYASHVNPDNLKLALAEGTVTRSAINRAVRRILRTIIRVGLLDGPVKTNASLVNSRSHRKLAFDTAAEGTVLLKNSGILPLDRASIGSIAVIGSAARDMQIGALGGSEVTPLRTVQILAGIAAAGRGIPVRFAEGDLFGEAITSSVVTTPDQPGFNAEYFPNYDLSGPPALTRVESRIQFDTLQSIAPGIPATGYSVRWTAKLTAPDTGDYTLAFTGDDGYRVYLDGTLLLDRWYTGYAETKKASVTLQAASIHDLRVEYFQAGGKAVGRLSWEYPSMIPYADAIAAAQQSDIAVVCVSTHGTEGPGMNRPSMDLPDGQDQLIKAVALANPRTIVVLNNGTPLTMKRWIDAVPAVLEAWFPGQEGGAAIAAILFGDINPSGKLPDTFAIDRKDYPDHGNPSGPTARVDFPEGIYVGYRNFDRKHIAPLFPFGHGLSYTTFRYRHLKLASQRLRPDGTTFASVVVTNTGSRAGDEIVQLYIRPPQPEAGRPVRELKGFARVSLQSGQTKTMRIPITPRDLAWFDVPGRQWKADAGKYDVEIGASSRDLRLSEPLRLVRAFTEKVPAE